MSLYIYKILQNGNTLCFLSIFKFKYQDYQNKSALLLVYNTKLK